MPVNVVFAFSSCVVQENSGQVVQKVSKIELVSRKINDNVIVFLAQSLSDVKTAISSVLLRQPRWFGKEFDFYLRCYDGWRVIF